MIVSTRSSKLNQTKKIFFHFYAQILAKCFDRFFEFSNFSILTIFNDNLLHLNRLPIKNAVCKMIDSTRSSKLNLIKQIFFLFYAQILSKHFDRFFNFSISPIFDDDLLPLNRVSRKKVTFHNVCLEKMKIMYISLFSFSNFCPTTFWMIGEVMFNFLKKWQRWKSTKVFANFMGTK